MATAENPIDQFLPSGLGVDQAACAGGGLAVRCGALPWGEPADGPAAEAGGGAARRGGVAVLPADGGARSPPADAGGGAADLLGPGDEACSIGRVPRSGSASGSGAATRRVSASADARPSM